PARGQPPARAGERYRGGGSSCRCCSGTAPNDAAGRGGCRLPGAAGDRACPTVARQFTLKETSSMSKSGSIGGTTPKVVRLEYLTARFTSGAYHTVSVRPPE